MKKLLVLTVIFALVLSACDSGINPPIGDTGPGGGIIFFAEGGQYKECSGELGSYNWDTAVTTARNYRGGGFTDWHLPDRGELDLMYENLYENGLGGFSKSSYWSSTTAGTSSAYYKWFDDDGKLYSGYRSDAYRVRAVRSYTISEPDPTPETTLTIKNMSDYDLINVDYSVNFGTINSGKDAVKDVSAGTRYIYFSLRTVNGDVRCRTDVFTCEEEKQNQITINNNTVITVTEDEQRGTLGNLFTALNKATTLKIKNESFTEITDVIWQNVSFANNQYENSIKPGTTVTSNVKAGAGYIFFKRKSNPIFARTADMVVVEKYEDIEFTFADNTPIVEVNNIANSGTLNALQSTVVWWDDAEGELQPYTLKQSIVEYYSGTASGYNYFYPPKNGSKSIRVGGTNTAMLQLRINLERNARLSFWYANRYYQTAGTIFSINGVEKAKWITDVDWSFLTFDLEPGENDLKWEKIDGNIYSYPNRYFYYLSLDDILIYYTE